MTDVKFTDTQKQAIDFMEYINGLKAEIAALVVEKAKNAPFKWKLDADTIQAMFEMLDDDTAVYDAIDGAKGLEDYVKTNAEIIQEAAA